MKAPLLAKAVLAPSVLLIGLCVYGYIGFTIYLSFTASTMMPVLQYTGPEAYVRLMGLNNWILSVKNLGIFAGLYIVCCAVLGLGLAVLIEPEDPRRVGVSLDLPVPDGAVLHRHRHRLEVADGPEHRPGCGRCTRSAGAASRSAGVKDSDPSRSTAS